MLSAVTRCCDSVEVWPQRLRRFQGTGSPPHFKEEITVTRWGHTQPRGNSPGFAVSIYIHSVAAAGQAWEMWPPPVPCGAHCLDTGGWEARPLTPPVTWARGRVTGATLSHLSDRLSVFRGRNWKWFLLPVPARQVKPKGLLTHPAAFGEPPN